VFCFLWGSVLVLKKKNKQKKTRKKQKKKQNQESKGVFVGSACCVGLARVG